MPSDPRVLEALDILARPIDRFRSTVAATLEDVRGELAASRSGNAGRAEQLKAQLGRFAEGRVDLTRLASVLGGDRTVEPLAQTRLEAAYDTLQDISARGKELFCVTVPSGTSVGAAVSAQLAAIGRAFGAARVAASARGVGTVLGMSDDQAMTRFPFAEWNTSERRLAPPIVVSVHGRDLTVAALGRFLDGVSKIVLLVDGPCAPAPLVRLITPNVFVIQAHTVKELEALGSWPGPAIGALMPPTSSTFVHDPASGPELWQRLSVSRSKDGHLARIGGLSAAQQTEEILQLEALASKPAAVVTPTAEATAAAGGTTDAADRLAAWLLQQANLTGPLGD